MTKSEALAKIAELKKFVEECDKPKKPEPTKGQVWRHYMHGLYLCCLGGNGVLALVSLTANPGVRWFSRSLSPFNEYSDDFEYVGMFSDVFTLRDRT